MNTDLAIVIIASLFIVYGMIRTVAKSIREHYRYRKALKEVLEVLEMSVDDPDYAAIDICRKALGNSVIPKKGER